MICFSFVPEAMKLKLGGVSGRTANVAEHTSLIVDPTSLKT